jgi:hypothetical protein
MFGREIILQVSLVKHNSVIGKLLSITNSNIEQFIRLHHHYHHSGSDSIAYFIPIINSFV